MGFIFRICTAKGILLRQVALKDFRPAYTEIVQDDLWDVNAIEFELWFNLGRETKADVYLNADSSPTIYPLPALSQQFPNPI